MKQRMLPLPASYMKTSRTPLEGLSHQAAFFFPANYEIIRPGAMKGPQTERERDHKAASHAPPLGTWPATQTCALTGNPTGDTLVCRLVLNPLSHTSQGSLSSYILIFLLSFHSYSNNTLPLVFYFLFFLLRSYMIVVYVI